MSHLIYVKQQVYENGNTFFFSFFFHFLVQFETAYGGKIFLQNLLGTIMVFGREKKVEKHIYFYN